MNNRMNLGEGKLVYWSNETSISRIQHIYKDIYNVQPLAGWIENSENQFSRNLREEKKLITMS